MSGPAQMVSGLGKGERTRDFSHPSEIHTPRPASQRTTAEGEAFVAFGEAAPSLNFNCEAFVELPLFCCVGEDYGRREKQAGTAALPYPTLQVVKSLVQVFMCPALFQAL